MDLDQFVHQGDIVKSFLHALASGRDDRAAKVVILDITGVGMVDSGVADHLNKTIQAARLKGTHTIVTGISDAVAETIRWSRANADVLADTHWIGGDPGRAEVYGWASWRPGKGILVLRNPSESPQDFSITPRDRTVTSGFFDIFWISVNGPSFFIQLKRRTL